MKLLISILISFVLLSGVCLLSPEIMHASWIHQQAITDPPSTEELSFGCLDIMDVDNSFTHFLYPLELEFHYLINRYRKSFGLQPLELHGRLNHIARQHSRNMATGTVTFGHDLWYERVTQMQSHFFFMETTENVAWTETGENIVGHTVTELINSPGHERNISGHFHLTGVGIYRSFAGRYYFTQIFINCSEPVANIQK